MNTIAMVNFISPALAETQPVAVPVQTQTFSAPVVMQSKPKKKHHRHVKVDYEKFRHEWRMQEREKMRHKKSEHAQQTHRQ